MKHQIEIELKIEQAGDLALIKKIAARKCRISTDEISAIEYMKRSLDCRSSKPKYVFALNVYTGGEKPEKINYHRLYKQADTGKNAIIIGAGPAGYFAALELLEHGIKPIVLERGKPVSERKKDIGELFSSGTVNPDSNYCFGEGGAGTYSDGKLFTRSVKRGNIRKVLELFVENGANPDIMIDAQPHIGSDVLPLIVYNIRKTIEEFGGEVHFGKCVDEFILKKNQIIGVKTADSDEFLSENVIMATGHSSLNLYNYMAGNKFAMEAKPFAVGFRIEHPQQMINVIRNGAEYADVLPPAIYKLVTQVGERGVYSFCMCPGGEIIPAVTEPETLVVNGMSNAARNSGFANAGVVCSIGESDWREFLNFGPIAGLKFREKLEHRFAPSRQSRELLSAPAQRVTDFIRRKTSSSLPPTSYRAGIFRADLNEYFPKNIADTLRNGLSNFGRMLHGYLTDEAQILGLESQTSSPVEHVDISGLFPCGEGSGYAGGIVSSAIDGINVANKIIVKYK